MNGTVRRLTLRDREFILVGTAHVSRESVDEVARVIQEEHPDRVCVEMDEGRLRAMRDTASWEKLDIVKVLKDGRGFLLMANLALSSFQRRLGEGLGVKPGDEMRRAVDVADEMGIAWSLCDREVQLTLKRAWSKCGFWSKNKLIAALLSSALSNEKLEEGQIESLKNQNELDGMMAELAAYLPAVKETLIDERDRYLATRIFLSEGSKIVAVIGAGHMEGVVARLTELDAGTLSTDLGELEKVPRSLVGSCTNRGTHHSWFLLRRSRYQSFHAVALGSLEWVPCSPGYSVGARASIGNPDRFFWCPDRHH